MERRIKIHTEATGIVEGVTTGENPMTAEAVWNALPLKGSANRWGDEIYFQIPLDFSEEEPKVEVEVGSIAYWPPGNALCIFFGPTPASKHNEPRAYSPVNVFARAVGNATIFRSVRDNDQISLEKAE
jgi:hypothetical protein